MEVYNLPSFHPSTFDLRELELPFSELEVWETIKKMPLDKAPGPDGFMGRFYKDCWSVIKEDVMAALHVLHRGMEVGFTL